MKRFPFCALLAATAALLFAGCANELAPGDRAMLGQHGVPRPIYDAMTYGEPLSLPDIMELSRRRIPPGFIIDYLRSTYAVYRLRSQDVVELRHAGVDPSVIDYLLRTPELYAPQPYYDGPWYPYGSYIGAGLYPPIFIGGSYHGHHDWHHWHHGH